MFVRQVLCCTYCRRKRKHLEEHLPQDEELQTLEPSNQAQYYPAMNIQREAGSNILDSDTELLKMRIDTAPLTLLKHICVGPFGCVWYGTYGAQPVAVKTLLQEKRTIGDSHHFANEIKLLTIKASKNCCVYRRCVDYTS